jgi:hypothetical protein
MHHDLMSHLLLHTNAGIAMDAARISDNEMKNWIGMIFVMTLSPIPNIEEDWREEDDGLYPRIPSASNQGSAREDSSLFAITLLQVRSGWRQDF